MAESVAPDRSGGTTVDSKPTPAGQTSNKLREQQECLPLDEGDILQSSCAIGHGCTQIGVVRDKDDYDLIELCY